MFFIIEIPMNFYVSDHANKLNSCEKMIALISTIMDAVNFSRREDALKPYKSQILSPWFVNH